MFWNNASNFESRLIYQNNIKFKNRNVNCSVCNLFFEIFSYIYFNLKTIFFLDDSFLRKPSTKLEKKRIEIGLHASKLDIVVPCFDHLSFVILQYTKLSQ